MLGLQEASSRELVLELSFLGQHPSKAKVCEEVTSGFRRLSLTSTGLVSCISTTGANVSFHSRDDLLTFV